jgi:Beta-carotene isomerase D27-like, C-terminal
MKDMGLPLEMTPDYDTFECQFSFGKTPLPPEQDEVRLQVLVMHMCCIHLWSTFHSRGCQAMLSSKLMWLMRVVCRTAVTIEHLPHAYIYTSKYYRSIYI